MWGVVKGSASSVLPTIPPPALQQSPCAQRALQVPWSGWGRPAASSPSRHILKGDSRKARLPRHGGERRVQAPQRCAASRSGALDPSRGFAGVGGGAAISHPICHGALLRGARPHRRPLPPPPGPPRPCALCSTGPCDRGPVTGPGLGPPLSATVKATVTVALTESRQQSRQQSVGAPPRPPAEPQYYRTDEGRRGLRPPLSCRREGAAAAAAAAFVASISSRPHISFFRPMPHVMCPTPGSSDSLP